MVLLRDRQNVVVGPDQILCRGLRIGVVVVKRLDGHDTGIVRDTCHAEAVVRDRADDARHVGTVIPPLLPMGRHIMNLVIETHESGVGVVRASCDDVGSKIWMGHVKAIVNDGNGHLPFAANQVPRLEGTHAFEAPELVNVRIVDGCANPLSSLSGDGKRLRVGKRVGLQLDGVGLLDCWSPRLFLDGRVCILER